LSKKKKDDDWVGDLIKLGIGLLAIYFMSKLLESGKKQEEVKICPNCGARVKKWARTCPVCRSNLIYTW